ncbi:hypothetical protein AAFX91_36495 [Bradyrhizobium sp. 31Argb]|uniref:hypothetical protein n=1 Tax=unclassified Bradyrhizobium TaxID=2631580 RepID=UPI00102E9EF5|nr:hypothetical protein [Bradyrhizobium sp. Leo170]
MSGPAKAGHPVTTERRFVVTGSSAGACHRAALRADPVADDDGGADEARQFLMRAGVAIFAAHHMIIIM